MLRKFYETVFDVELYYQMADLICRLSEKNNKEQLYRRIQQAALFLEKPGQEMEEDYGFRYPGEVLERLDEKAEVTERQLRALGLALAETKELQDDGMFIGKQKPSFWKRLKRTLGQSDLYWLGIQYLSGDGQQKELYKKLLDFPAQSVEEMVFILSVLPDEHAVWETVKGKLDRLLGKDRSFSVYTHTEIYAWLSMHFQARVSGYRKKDIETLKYVLRLPFSYAKAGSTAREKLLEAGYSAEEVMFLSMSLLPRMEAQGALKKNGLTAERMAVETCMLFLGGDGRLLDQAGDLCRQLLTDYRSFDVRLNDTSGIFDRLYELLKVENIHTYCLLLSCDGREELHSDWFLIDLTEPKWQGLYTLLERKCFDKWVFQTLKRKPYTKDEIKAYLSAYKNLTGEEFFTHFWNSAGTDLSRIFQRLAELELVHPVFLLEEYLEEDKGGNREACQKWGFMAEHLKAYMEGLKTPEAVEMLFRMEKASGISRDTLLPMEELLWNGLGIWLQYGRISFSGLDFSRPFLSVEEHQRIFAVTERYLFQRYPEQYIPFLVQVLTTEANFSWFPKAEARSVFLQLSGMDKELSGLERLREIYLTEGELEAIRAKEKELEERHLWLEEREKIRAIRKEFDLLVAKTRNTETQFKQLLDYVQRYYTGRRSRKERRFIVKRYLCSLFERKQGMLIVQKEAESLCQLATVLFVKAELDFSELKWILNQVEFKKEAA